MYLQRWLCLTLIGLSFGLPAYSALPTGSDVVAMKNGDIYNGTAAQDRFIMRLPYGTVSVPYGQMSTLRFGKSEEPDQLTTRLGDRFIGQMEQLDITMIRVFDPTIPLTTEDISEIVFAPRPTRSKEVAAPDTVLTQNGDRFSARITTGDILMTSASAIKLVSRSDIHLIDFTTLLDGEDYLAQITGNDGQIIQGRLSAESISVKTRYGDDLKIPVTGLSTLAFRVNRQGGAPGIGFHKRVNPQDVIRDQLRDGSSGSEMLVLRGGSFLRGDSRGDEDEKPQKQVKLKPFAIGIHEVTFDEYDRFCEENGRSKPDDSEWGRGYRPVINVTWKDATAYAEWLSRQTGQNYRLPTDAEWEYAARGGTSSRFWWGDEEEKVRANCEGCGSLWDGEKSAPVGSFPPNSFGLHDTAGNVFEWVADCWNDSFADAPADGAALEKKDCVSRVIRGGAWSFPSHEIRSANRWRDFSTRQSDDTGFRLVRELE